MEVKAKNKNIIIPNWSLIILLILLAILVFKERPIDLYLDESDVSTICSEQEVSTKAESTVLGVRENQVTKK